MIDSVNNEKVMFFKKLRDKKHILENNCYIVEGEHLVIEAYKSGLLLSVLVTPDYESNYDVETYVLSEKCMKSISLLKSVPPVMGVVKLNVSNEIKGEKIVLLDNVQDPGNVGTIIRSALAFNVSTVVLSPDSVNIFNDKMIRSSEGTIFNMNVVVMDLKDAISLIQSKGISVYYADMFGKYNLDELEVKEYALVLGSEGKGISPYIKELTSESINVPMNNLCESLNVGVTGGIIMYKFR